MNSKHFGPTKKLIAPDKNTRLSTFGLIAFRIQTNKFLPCILAVYYQTPRSPYVVRRLIQSQRFYLYFIPLHLPCLIRL
jgi:hypothetical protein